MHYDLIEYVYKLRIGLPNNKGETSVQRDKQNLKQRKVDTRKANNDVRSPSGPFLRRFNRGFNFEGERFRFWHVLYHNEKNSNEEGKNQTEEEPNIDQFYVRGGR